MDAHLRNNDQCVDDAEVLPGVSASDQSSSAVAPLDRPRPSRERLVPVWLIASAVVVGCALLAVGVLALVLAGRDTIAVPNVVGRDVDAVRVELTRLGLELRVESRAYSDRPAGEVLTQSPAEGELLREGETVTVIVSGGSDEFPLPDVVGTGLALARGTLEAKGLAIRVENVISDEPSDTILSTRPSAGARVRTGDLVTLVVATSHAETITLKPYVLDGVTVLIDPAPASTASSDPAMEVARRLRSLLEASGATVSLLRSASDSATTDIDRARRALSVPAAVAVGLSLTTKTTTSRYVSYPDTATVGPAGFTSEQLASKLAANLSPVMGTITASSTTSDSVLWLPSRPWFRVVLGSPSVREDAARFSDPQWADAVARSLYAVIGEQFATGVR